MTDVFIVDVETSGLSPYDADIVFSVGISKVDIEKKTVKPIYDKIIGYDTKDWPRKWKEAYIFGVSNLSLDDIDKAYDAGQYANIIGKEVHDILVGNKIAIYNVGFDYSNFLRHPPFNITRKNSTILKCLMLASTSPCGLENEWDYYQFKWPKLHESFEILVPNKIQKSINIDYHDAKSDTIAAGWIMLELIKNYGYSID